MLDDLQGRLDATQVSSASANRIRLESEQDMFVLRLDAEGEEKTWLLTAYEKKQQGAQRTTVRSGDAPEGSSPSAPLRPEGSASARLDQEADEIDRQIAEDRALAEARAVLAPDDILTFGEGDDLVRVSVADAIRVHCNASRLD